LEVRTLLTILFPAQDGAETLHPQGGNTLSSPPVNLVFWGSYWQSGVGVGQQAQIVQAAQTLFDSGYFSLQKQYGTDGKVTMGAVANFGSNPGQNFSTQNIVDAVHFSVDNGLVPEPDATSNQGIYVLFTPPGIISGQGSNVGGYNAYTFKIDGFDLDDEVYCWVGGGTNANTFSLDTYTYLLSHEVTEAITDPQSFRPFPNIGFNGYRVDPGANFPNPPSNSNQIADYEAQNYTYRLDGVQVQSYWSNQDQAFVIGDGNSQTFIDNLGTLIVNGDQFGANYNDFITVSQNASGGVRVDLNGEIASFDQGVIKNIVVNPGGGNNAVFVTKTIANVPVTINLAGSQDNVYVLPTAGLSDIQGAVNVNGFSSNATLTVDDTPTAGPENWTVTGSSVTRDGAAAISYNNLQNIVVVGGAGSTRFQVQGTEADGATTIYTGDASLDGVFVQATTGPLTINDGAGSGDLAVVSQTPQNLDTVPGLVTVNGQGTSDRMSVLDTNNPNKSSWTISGTQIVRSYGTVGVGGGGASTITVDYSGLHEVDVFGGSGGAGFDVSPTAHDLDELPPRLVVTGFGGNASNSLTGEDRSNPNNSQWTVTDTKVTRTYNSAAAGKHTAGFEYHDIQKLVLNGGSGANSYDFVSTGAATTTRLNTGTGNDTVDAGAGNNDVLDAILGPIIVVGQGGADSLALDDQNSNPAHTYALSAGTVTRDSIAHIHYVGLSGVIVRGGRGGNQFNVSSISFAAPFTIYGGPGNDTVNLNNPNLNDNPNLIHQLTFFGQGGTDTLNLNDQASAAAAQYTLGPNSLTISGAPLLTIDYDSTLENLHVNAGTGNDTFLIVKASPTTAITVNGGGGVNTLNYGAFSGDIKVNVPLGIATGLSGGISNIQNVFGSMGNDLIVGDSGTNALSGGTGRNIIIGGAGGDHVSGGGGDNILIGGTTNYDTNMAALNDFLTEWLRKDLTFQQRVVDIATGGVVPSNLPASVLKGTGFRLNSKTVHTDNVTNILTGSPGLALDWFFDDPSFDTLQNTKPGDVFTVV
jgi:hypothetical protein